ncbi:hypothetical protein D3C87_1469330 [compost metagenome]
MPAPFKSNRRSSGSTSYRQKSGCRVPGMKSMFATTGPWASNAFASASVGHVEGRLERVGNALSRVSVGVARLAGPMALANRLMLSLMTWFAWSYLGDRSASSAPAN